MRRYESGETTIHLISPARPEALADVIFIHGLNGHAETTWMHNENDNESFWPQWLAQDLPETYVWIAAVGAKTAYIMPGSPWENGFLESFNARLRNPDQLRRPR